jgi:hypothetical protein
MRAESFSQLVGSSGHNSASDNIETGFPFMSLEMNRPLRKQAQLFQDEEPRFSERHCRRNPLRRGSPVFHHSCRGLIRIPVSPKSAPERQCRFQRRSSFQRATG